MECARVSRNGATLQMILSSKINTDEIIKSTYAYVMYNIWGFFCLTKRLLYVPLLFNQIQTMNDLKW